MVMEVNGEKCKIMQVGEKQHARRRQHRRPSRKPYHRESNDFKYLGAYISDNAKCEKEIKSRLAMALASITKYNKI